MKYLEEIQRKKEARREEVEKRERMELMKRRREFGVKRAMNLRRIRLGTFKLFNGVLRYYDDVRAEDKGWIQYEDASGVPYYYDVVSKTTQYRRPEGQEIVHHSVLERTEYDAAHGEGAYDAMIADHKWKDQCNRDGGYYDEFGDWVQLHGYYDENYEFVDLDKGYFDENGEWVAYTSDNTLDFMV